MKALSSLLLAFLIVGCDPPGPLPKRQVDQRLEPKDIVGTWELSADSLALMVRDGYELPSPEPENFFELNVDGTLKFSSPLDHFHLKGHTIATGTWELQHDAAVGNAQANNLLELNLVIPGNIFFSMTLEFVKKEDRLIAWTYHRDPDQWEYREWVKQADGREQSPSA